MSKHTPGPWMLRNDPYADGKPYFRFTAGKGYYGNGFELSGILSDTDARLIAAAPEMADALKEVMDWIGSNFEEEAEWPETRDRVKALLARIEGTTP